MKRAGGGSKSRFLILGAVFVALAVFVGGILVGVKRGIPFVKNVEEWSIGLYKGSDPFHMSPVDGNPILKASDVTDAKAEFVADPFIINHNNSWAIFFEVLNKKDMKGDIGVATSVDGNKFKYRGIVIDEKWHLSYPQVFEDRGQLYLMPESSEDKSLNLYRAVDYPMKWERVKTLMSGRIFIDSNIIKYDDKWYIFSTTSKNGDIMRLFYADDLLGEWKEHPKSPILVENPRLARGGGYITMIDGKLYRFAQDASNAGKATMVRVVEVTKLSESEYEETEASIAPVASPSGKGWNMLGMHQFAIQKKADGSYLASADGFRKTYQFDLKD
jgi:hypothetical protein